MRLGALSGAMVDAFLGIPRPKRSRMPKAVRGHKGPISAPASNLPPINPIRAKR